MTHQAVRLWERCTAPSGTSLLPLRGLAGVPCSCNGVPLSPFQHPPVAQVDAERHGGAQDSENEDHGARAEVEPVASTARPAIVLPNEANSRFVTTTERFTA